MGIRPMMHGQYGNPPHDGMGDMGIHPLAAVKACQDAWTPQPGTECRNGFRNCQLTVIERVPHYARVAGDTRGAAGGGDALHAHGFLG